MARTLKKKATFSLREPHAARVQLAADFSDWEKKPINLKRQKDGVWTTTVELPPGTYQYRFLVDGHWQDDPACPTRTTNPYGDTNCVKQIE
jgi:1,4-alpha-glucan branching enzyme